MKILRSIFLLSVGAAIGVAGPTVHARTLNEVMGTGTLKVVTTASSPPHGFLDPASNQLQGIMVDVAQAIGKHMGVKVELTEVPFDGLIPTLTTGRADLMSAPLFVTAERGKVVDFSAPIYGWGEAVVLGQSQTKRYRRLEDFKGAKVGTLVDSVQYRMIKDLPGTQVVTYQEYFPLLADIRAGRVDLGVVDPPSVQYQMKLKSISGVKFDDSYQPQKKYFVAAATQKGNAALLDSVNNALDRMILTKWGVADLEAK
jgi:polar amino acid transport system substrate-binding protein